MSENPQAPSNPIPGGPSTTSSARPTNTSLGASYCFSIAFTSFLFWSDKIASPCGLELRSRQPFQPTMAQPELQEHDLAQLGVVALEPCREALQA